ncbi:MAG: Hsp20/alpha crystallin family protein [Bryobacteraceae bacterium]
MLVKHRPFDEFGLARSMRDFDDVVRTFFGDPQSAAAPVSGQPWTPPVDIAETEHELVVKADLPEVKPEDLEVKVENGTLTLKGKREFEKKEDAKGYHRIERSYGSFVRAFSLPDSVDPEKIQAGYTNGVLTITLAKKELAKPRTVKVSVQAA